MIEIHDVLEYETAARLHVVPKNKGGLQGAVIIDRIAVDVVRRYPDSGEQETGPLRLASRPTPMLDNTRFPSLR